MKTKGVSSTPVRNVVGRLLRMTAVAFVAISLGQATSIHAESSVAEFYHGNTITFYIGAFAGGGYDNYARMLARYIGKYIPGNPSVVPENMPGAASGKAATYINSIARRDGTAVGAILPGTVVDPLLGAGNEGRYDPSKLLYLGSASSDDFVCFVRSDQPVYRFQDVFEKKVIAGATQEGGSNKTFSAMLDNLLGAKFKLVSGYPGTTEMMLALQRDETAGMCGVSWSSLSVERPDWISSGFIRILAQENATGTPVLDQRHVPLTITFAPTLEDKKIMELVYSQEKFGRPFILPPGVPDDRVVALRAAFIHAIHDPQLLQDAKRMGLDVSPISGQTLQSLIEKIYSTPKPIVDRAREALIYRDPN